MNKMVEIIEKYFNGIEHEVLNVGKEVEFNEMEYDSRNIKEGDVFAALVGAYSDGHDYIDMAIKKGAKFIIVSKIPENINRDISYVKLDNVRQKLGFVATNFYNNPQSKLKIAGVTGTNGKTTTTYILESILGKCARIGTVEYKIGDELIPAPNTTPESLDLIKMCRKAVNKGIEYFVMEVSSHALEMGRVEMLEFDTAIFTNLSQDHLDYHNTMEEYFLAKKKLFYKLKNKDKSSLNIDDSHGKIIFDEFGGISYSEKKRDADIYGEVLGYGNHRMKIKIYYKERSFKFDTKLMGQFNLYNIMGAVGAALKLGIDIETIINRIKTIEGVPGRCEAVDAGQDFMVIIDYAHTPDGLVNILQTLKDMKTNRIITLFGAGGDRDKTKRPLMAKAAAEYSDLTILTSDNPRTENAKSIIDDLELGLKEINYKNYEIFIDRKEAIKEAVNLAEKGDILLIAGKGHETYQVIGKEKIDFNEKAIVVDAIKDKENN